MTKEGYGGGTVSCLTHNYKDLGFDIKVKIPDTVTNTSDPSNKTAECSALDGTLTTHLYFLFLVLMCLYFKLKNSLHHSSSPSFPWASLPPFLLSLLCFFFLSLILFFIFWWLYRDIQFKHSSPELYSQSSLLFPIGQEWGDLFSHLPFVYISPFQKIQSS